MGRAFNHQLISGGNNQNFKQEVYSLENGGRHEWLWKMNFLQWYTNSIIFEGNEELEKIKPYLIEIIYWNGLAGVIEYGGEKIPVALTGVKFGMNGYIKSAKVSSRFPTINGKSVNRKNCAFFQANVYRWPLFLGLEELYEPIIKVFNLIEPELQNAISSLIFKVDMKDKKDLKTKIALIEEATRKVGQLITIIPNDLGEHVELKTKESIGDKLWDAIKSYKNYAFHMTGRLYNASEKSDRNLTSEVSLNELQFTAIRNDYLLYIKEGAHEYDEVFGTTTNLRPLQEVENERQQELQMAMSNQLSNNQDNDKDKKKEKK